MFKQFRQTVGKFFLGHSLTSMGVWSWLMPGEWSKSDLIAQYRRIMYAVISAIAEDSAKIEFNVYKKTDEKKTPIDKHAFHEFIRRPNPDQSQFQFLELHWTFLKLVGESYWYIVNGKRSRVPQSAYLLRPDLMQ